MKIVYNKDINLNKLHDELLNENLINPADYFGSDYFIAPDNADMEKINQIIITHDPTPAPQPPTELELLKKQVSENRGAIDFMVMNF